MEKKSQSFIKRTKSMFKVDSRRMFTTPFFYILLGISFVIPVLILVMTSMMDGMVSVDPQTGKETVMEGFTSVWQILGSVSSASSAGMSMDLVSMCNINMMYFAVAVLVCVFVCDDFRSGYAKNLFTVRAKKTDYIASKTLICFIGGALMIIAFVLGSLLGGGISHLSFAMEGFNAGNLICCVLTKAVLTLIFVPIYLVMSVVAKQKSWLALLLSFGVGMFMFNIAPMVSPLDSTLLHALLSIAGGVGFAVGLGAISNIVLKKTRLV